MKHISLIIIVLLALMLLYKPFRTKLHHIFEHFEERTTPYDVVVVNDFDTAELVDHENKKCKYFLERGGEHASQSDTINNYILVNNPKGVNECYIKGSDTIVGGNCSKQNPALYNSEFEPLIDDIYEKQETDGYMSTIIPQSACVIKYSQKQVPAPMIKKYLDHLDFNIPKLKHLRDEIVNTEKEYQNLTVQRNDEEARKESLTATVNNNNKIIGEQNTQILALDGEITTKNNVLADLNNKFDEKRNKYQSRQKLVAIAYAGADYTDNAVSFPIGRYNNQQMIWQGLNNDTLSSIKVPDGLIVTLFNDAVAPDTYQPTGSKKFLTLDKNEPWIGNQRWADGTQQPGLNDSISSIIVEAKPIE